MFLCLTRRELFEVIEKKIGRGGLEFIISLSKLWHMYNGVKTSRLLLNPGFATNCTRKFISKKSHKKWINFIYIWNIDIMPPYSDLLQNTIKIPASFFSMYLSKYFNLASFNFLHYIYLYFLLNLSAAEYFFSKGLKVIFLCFFFFSVSLCRLI